MWHTLFIVIHAAAGLVAFGAGCVALRRGALFSVYLWSLACMVFFLALAIAAEWGQLVASERTLFSAFGILGGFMLVCATLAARRRPSAVAGPSARYIDQVGFTLIALFDAFMVISVLDLGGPGWLVTATGVAVAIAGHFVLQSIKRRLVPTAGQR